MLPGHPVAISSVLINYCFKQEVWRELQTMFASNCYQKMFTDNKFTVAGLVICKLKPGQMTHYLEKYKEQ
jgi:hypothetical protein